MEIVAYNPLTANAALERIRSRTLQMHPELIARVAEIIEGVRAGGDEALIHYTEKFDGVTLQPDEIRVDAEFIRAMAARADAGAVQAFRQAIGNVRAFHEHQRETDWQISLADGATVGQRMRAVAAAGLYVPGGRAAYPSSVLMNAVPAQVAGVRRIAIATPPGTLEKVPAVAAVIHELGITEVYRVGGAQAVAALAYGTATIAPVAKIVGPGNAYVAAAKRQVFGTVGIDMIAGPSEVLVIADDTANASWIAADLLAQAEHDESAQSILITDSKRLASEVEQAVEAQLKTLPRGRIAGASWQDSFQVDDDSFR